MCPGQTTDSSGRDRRFKTTRWSVIVASVDAQTGEPKATEALAHLCRIYWRPIFAFVARRTPSQQDAEDLTQDFFVTVLTGDLLRRADPERGRFRSLLLTSLQNFLNGASERAQALKRGGAAQFISWDEWMAEAPSHLMVSVGAEKTWSAEKVFDVRWAATVAEQALRRLEEECEAHKRQRVFDVLSGTLTAEREDISYETLARELGVKAADVKRLRNRLRQRFRELLRAEVADTVADPGDVDDEVRYLVAALSTGMESGYKPA
ncbi:MAG: sigma-70 family RNA polymerase sigma factor [Chthoniobacterales bacterium]